MAFSEQPSDIELDTILLASEIELLRKEVFDPNVWVGITDKKDKFTAPQIPLEF